MKANDRFGENPNIERLRDTFEILFEGVGEGACPKMSLKKKKK